MTDLRWQQAHLGGGGFITGLLVDPFNPDHLFARSDVAGAFVSTDGGRTWLSRNAGLDRQHHNQVAALTPSPHTPDLLIRGCGDTRNGRCYGSLHRSTDAGRSWTQVSEAVDFYGNGPLRAYGELVSFDPFDPSRVLAAGYNNGVFDSDDEGLTWTAVYGKGLRHSVIRHHPSVPGLVYAGTAGDLMLTGPYSPTLTFEDQVAEHGDRLRGNDAVLFRSTDGGRTFQEVSRIPDSGFTALEFGADPGLVLASSATGIWRSEDFGATLRHSGSGMPDAQADVVRADPHRPGRYLSSTYLGVAPFPVYESLDHGTSWALLRAAESIALQEYPPYLDRVERLGEMVNRIVFHPTLPDTWFITGWWGVSRTDDAGATFSGHHFQGLETTCLESVTADPAVPPRVYLSVADHPPWAGETGRSFRSFPQAPRNSTGLAASPHLPGLVVFGMSSLRWHNGGATLHRSDDAGLTTQLLHAFPGRQFVHSISADHHVPQRFWIAVDGDRDADPGPGLYRLDGHTLQYCGFPAPIGSHLPEHEGWLESELLPIVVYQKRNVMGCNHLVAADPHLPDRLYLAEPTRGLWRSDDAAATWVNITSGLPLQHRRTSTLVHVQPDPLVPDRVYAGFVSEGLWRTDDAGATWSPVLSPATTGEDAVNATGLAIHPQHPEVLVVPGEPMWWNDTRCRLRLSRDAGATWTDIFDPEQGPLRMKQAAFDGTGRLYLATVGNGIYVIDAVE